MFYEESLHTRRIIGKIAKGESLIDALEKIASNSQFSSGKIEVTGSLEGVELIRYDASKKEWLTLLESNDVFDIISIHGNIATIPPAPPRVHLQAMLAAYGPAGQQIVYGDIRQASVVHAEFTLETATDLDIQFKPDPERQLLVMKSIQRVSPQEGYVTKSEGSVDRVAPTPTSTNESRPEPKPVEKKESPKPAVKTWADAAKASNSKADEIYASINLDEPILSSGDTLIHRELGRCIVLRVEDDEFAHVRMSRGKIRKLKLSLLNVKFVETAENGKNVFDATALLPPK